MTLAEFLLARFDEDERREWLTCTDCGCSGARCHSYGAEGRKCCPDCRHPARVLAEVEAKRKMLMELEERAGTADGGGVWFDLMCYMSKPYADHPDYRQEWKP